MYTQEEINNDRKNYLSEQKENCRNLLQDTEGTEICWEISSRYEQDKWDANLLDVFRTEEEAIEVVKDMEEEGVEVFYRPIVIDSDSGCTVNFQNLHYYKKGSYFLIKLNEYLKQ